MKLFYSFVLMLPLLAAAFEITPRDNKYLYRTGETVVFQTNLGSAHAGKVCRASLRGPGITRQFSLPVKPDGSVTLPVTLEKPGFVYLQLTAGKEKASAGVAFSPEKIRSARQKPAEFDRFWDAAVKELDLLPLKYEITEIKNGVVKGFKVFDVVITMPDAADPVYTILTVPENSLPGRVPARLFFHGAGTDKIKPIYQKGIMTLSVNPMPIRHNGKQGSSIRTKNARFYGYSLWGVNDLSKNFFPGMFKRAYRALQFVKSLPEWDQRTLIVSGGSQGGAQAIAAAALDPQVTLCSASVPALCDHGGYLRNDESGWPRYRNMAKFKDDPEKALAVLDMIDVVFFASRIRNAKVIITTGFIDRTCVSSSVYAAFNALEVKDKQIFNDFRTPHTTAWETQKKINAIINEHIRQKKLK